MIGFRVSIPPTVVLYGDLPQRGVLSNSAGHEDSAYCDMLTDKISRIPSTQGGKQDRNGEHAMISYQVVS